jgi:hypothetical protein
MTYARFFEGKHVALISVCATKTQVKSCAPV